MANHKLFFFGQCCGARDGAIENRIIFGGDGAAMQCDVGKLFLGKPGDVASNYI
jgi:hypothetical protein